jgi:hypothetical protein
MSTILKVQPRVTRLINYIKEIEEGKLQIPSFQRDFVWGKKEKLELFESLKLGYPIGSLLFWKPKEVFRVKDEIGPYKIPKIEGSDSDFFYILDGFQRLSTLFGCLINPNKTLLETNENDLIKEFSIFYDLVNEEFTLSRSTPTDITYIPVNSLIDTYAFLDYVEKLRSQINDVAKSTILIDKARLLSSAILDYQLPSIEIIGGTIEDAVDIFSRINSKGSKISVDWMVSALTYNESLDFRLGTEIDQLINNLQAYNYEKIKRELILQCVQSSFGKVYFDETVSDLVKKSDFISVTKKTILNIEKAVKFLFEQLLVIDIKLLPYNNQLIFFTYFFNEIENPTESQLQKLKQWFWVTTYSSYFTIYSLSKQRQAFYQFKNFVAGSEEIPTFNDKPNIPFTVTDFPKNIYFGSVRAKALVLFLLNVSNNFEVLNVDAVDELKIMYLFQDSIAPENVIPLINYIGEMSLKNVIQTKQKDLSFILENSYFDQYASRFFLNDAIRLNYKNNNIVSALIERKRLIKAAEQEFVNEMGLQYE